MNKLFIRFVILFVSLFCLFPKAYAAEILQVSSSSILLVGDNNRTYTVKIACTEISPDLEDKSVNWLRQQLPRHTKINLRPKGSVDGVLEAKIVVLDSDIDISEKYINEGLATNKC